MISNTHRMFMVGLGQTALFELRISLSLTVPLACGERVLKLEYSSLRNLRLKASEPGRSLFCLILSSCTQSYSYLQCMSLPRDN